MSKPRFQYPEALRKGYRRRLMLIARDTRRRLNRLQDLGLSSAQFESAALDVKTQVLLEHTEKTARWMTENVATRSRRDFRRLLNRGSRVDDSDLVRQFYLRQYGVIESLVDKLVQAAIGHYAATGSMRKFNWKPHAYRARFYAQDQVGQAYNDITRLRARHEGSDRYVWVRTTSAHPRDFHLDRVGKTYGWDDLDDPPGRLPNCKCTAKPVFP
jgi:hypothetical protein